MQNILEFTGERFTPECVREIWYEHWHRYAFARRWAAGRRVLDVACGEGYGAALLAGVAASVTGADLNAAAVAHARTRYPGGNLRFIEADATNLSALPAQSFDLITSFETLEHVAAQDALLAGCARLLAPGGMLMVSTPDKRQYTDATGVANPHHVQELYREEFEALLARHFPAVQLFAQKLLFQSVLWPASQAPKAVLADTASAAADRIDAGLAYPPLYYLAVCAQAPSALPTELDGVVSLFGDAGESVYTHYNDEVRKHIAAGTRLAALELELERLRAENLELRAAHPAGEHPR